MNWRDLVSLSKFAYRCARYGFPKRSQENIRFTDLNYIATYDLGDLPFYSKQCQLIKAAKQLDDAPTMEKIARGINDRIERAWQGQYVAPTDHKPLEVGRKYDLVLQTGLMTFAFAIMENRGTPFNHMASGDGTTDPMLGDLQLEAEKARMSLDEGTAFRFANGETLRWGGFFQPGFVTHVVSEVGLVSHATTPPGFFMNRAVFPVVERVTHTVHSDFYGVAINITLSSV